MSEVMNVIAADKKWYRETIDLKSLEGRWRWVTDPDELNQQFVETYNPEYVFFLHWSTRISEDIYKRCTCIGFHMTDLPFGRGGSPLQNLIQRGVGETKLTAFRIADEFDSGPIYMKRNLTLSGSAQEVYLRSALISLEMVKEIIRNETIPVEQQGQGSVFPRRSPAESVLPKNINMKELYDYIRMLDADGYPHAFIEKNNLKFELTGASLDQNSVNANVKITRSE